MDFGITSVASNQTLWAILLLMLGQTESLHMIFTLVAFYQNFVAYSAVGFEITLAESFTACIARCWAIRADHDVVGHITSLE
jgi:hypothetical protein